MTEPRTQSAKTTLVQLSLITTLMTLMGCTTTQVITANSKPPVQLQTVISDAERVDVMIMPFAPNLETLPDAGSDDIPVSAEIRWGTLSSVGYGNRCKRTRLAHTNL